VWTGRIIGLRCVLLLLALIAAGPLSAKVFGADQRAESLQPLKPEEQKRFAAVGVIECQRGDGSRSFGAATLVGSRDTAITAAHVLIDAKTGPIDLSSCMFAVMRGGEAVDAVPIRYIQSPWQESARAGDPSLDYAIIKLGRKVDRKLRVKPLAIGSLSLEEPEVELVAYHQDLPDFRIARKSTGAAYALPADSLFVPNHAAEGIMVSRPERIVASDYPSVSGTSGAPVFQGGRIVGLHGGSFFVRRTEQSPVFSTRDNFNQFLALDREIADAVKGVARAR
jgi:V8-like Glu-specific endopeptidase